jgi:hypothetical protein
MNFRTTILLLVVLIAAGVLYFITTSKESAEPQPSAEKAGGAGKKLLTVANSGAVNKVVITRTGGERLVLERGAGASEWNLVEPVKGPAESWKVDQLVQPLVDLRSTGQTEASGKGVDQPRYVVELTDKDNKTTKINVGNRSSVGDILYVQVAGEGKADIVSSAVVEQLEKPASEFRKARLLTTPNEKITGVTISHENQTLKLVKNGENWQITEPKPMPGDADQISSLLTSITGLDAAKFVSEDAKNLAEYGLDKPQMTITYTTAPPETQPAATQSSATTKPGGDVVTIKFGAAQDVLNKYVYATASPAGPVVTIDATKLEAFKKTPLDLRDRKVVDVNPDAVSKLAISVQKSATTQPTSQPASKHEVALERRSEQPTTAATTSPATTKSATTQPTAIKSKWLLAGGKGDANDLNVQLLLDALHPLRAEKYLENFAATQKTPVATYEVKISTRAWVDEAAHEHDLKITDPGGEAKLVGQMGDLAFEMDRGIIEKLTAEFAAPNTSTAGPVFAPVSQPATLAVK